MNKYVVSILVLLLFFSLGNDFSKLLPVDWFSFRAWESLTEEAEALGPFVPSSSSHKDKAYGDLANTGNIRRDRFYRPETITSDACGARNKSVSATDIIDGIYLGASYGAGAALNDDEVLTEKIYKSSGLKIYNLAGIPTGPLRAETLTSQFKFKNPVVILELPERFDAKYFEGRYLFHKNFRSNNLIELCRQPAESFSESITRIRSRESRLRIFASQIKKFFQDDVVLPNPYRDQVFKATLTGQEKALHPLFILDELDHFTNPKNPEPVAEVFIKAAKMWEGFGFKAVVLIIPAKLRIYEKYITPTPFNANPNYLKSLAQSLNAAGITALNLEDLYAGMAAQGQIPFISDDTHWNPQGVEAAAGVVVQALHPSQK